MILKFYGVKPLFQMTLFFIIQVNTSLLNTKVCFSDEIFIIQLWESICNLTTIAFQ